MKMEFGKDDLTPALAQLVKNASPAQRESTLKKLANRLRNLLKLNLADEKNYDGSDMRSPAKETKFGGRFAKSYKWRYRPGFMLATKEVASTRRTVQESATIDKKGYARTRFRVRRRIEVTEDSKQLQDTGGLLKSIDILSVDCNRAAVGPKTGHGQKIAKVHQENEDIPEAKRRKPIGISDEFADEAVKFAADDLMKGV